jgi:NhaA family Na+:H+ antiporter
MADKHDESGVRFPVEPIHRLTAPLQQFLHVETSGGVVLLAAAAAALILANTRWADSFLSIWETQFSIGLGSFQMSHSLKHWINDGLMAIFFFTVGLEVKREMVLGELRDPRRAALPIAAALGGMIAPALVYLFLQYGEAGQNGWGIPMATDIAFVVGCMLVLGKRVPLSLRVLVLSLAIADDIGAILVIAIGYTESLDYSALFLGFVGIGAVVVLARTGMRSVAIYAILGAFVWLCFHESGVHATVAGVILGLLTPAGSWIGKGTLKQAVMRAGMYLHGKRWENASDRVKMMGEMEKTAKEGISPLERLEYRLHPYVSFVIMPLFALANAGVPIRLSDFASPIAVAVMFGLVVGKPLGIVLFSYVSIRLGIARMPAGVGWGHITGGGLLAGIGFTMAMFIASLALGGTELDSAKIGILGASAIAAVAGMLVLMSIKPRAANASS